MAEWRRGMLMISRACLRRASSALHWPPTPKPSDRRATLNPSQMQDWKRPGGGGDSFSLNSAPAPPPSTHHDAASDPWGAGTTWERDSPAAKAQAAGIPAVVCGPGSIDQAHGPDEYVELDQLARAEVFMERLLERLQQ